MREPVFWHGPASLNAHLLKPLAALYGAIAAQRLQRRGLNAGIPVLCVGNYHVGGAGKTPTVLALAKLLRDLGETPVVLSRGYGGKLAGPVRVDPARHAASDVGDEPLMMAGAVPVPSGEPAATHLSMRSICCGVRLWSLTNSPKRGSADQGGISRFVTRALMERAQGRTSL